MKGEGKLMRPTPVVCFFLFTSVLVAVRSGVTADATSTTWTVDDDGPADFHTMNQAISASSNGDTVMVLPGIYSENLAVTKSIALKGESPQTTIIQGSGGFAVVQITANSVALANFTIWNGNIGVLVDRSSNNRIINNVITGNNDGLWVASSGGNTISGNTVVNNTVGMFLDSSNTTILDRNVITSNTYGIDMENCRQIIVRENNMTSSRSEGIFAYQSDNGTVFRNTLQNNQLAIHLDNSNGNNIFQNNFINNSRQVYTTNSDNTWDNGSNGNYWSDYKGTDSNNDGLGDTAYVLNADNQDRYPLMEPFAKPFLLTDINNDGRVNILDIGIIAKSYGAKQEDPRWNPDADIDKNGIINILDMAMVAEDFGKTA